MKTNLKDNIWIEGFDDKIKFVAGHCFYNDNDQLFDVIYFGGTSEIPKEIAREVCELQQVFNDPKYIEQDIDRYRNYRLTNYIWFDCTAKQSIMSACSQEYCIIYKTKSMKAKRVECDNCANFIPAVFTSYFSFDKSQNAKCKLGKRVMFRKPTLPGISDDNSGYFRYCNEFKEK